MPITREEFENPEKCGLKAIFIADPDHAYSFKEILALRKNEPVDNTRDRLLSLSMGGYILTRYVFDDDYFILSKDRRK